MSEKKQDNKEGKIISIESYERKARSIRMKNTAVIVGVVTLLLIAAVSFFAYESKRVRKTYESVTMTSAVDVRGSTVIPFGNEIITYNSDGIHCIDVNGKDRWTGTFEMLNPMVVTGKDRVAVADKEGREIFIYDRSGKLTKIDTASPVLALQISEGGLVYASLDEGEVTAIYCYDPMSDNADKTISRINSTMEGSGYPLAFGASPSGRLFAVSYLTQENGRVSSRVAFYNFGEVGQNIPNNLMKTYTYTGESIPLIHFLDNDTAFAVSGPRLIFYSDPAGQDPESKKEIFISEEIRSVFWGDGTAVLVFDDKDAGGYRADVYNKNGELTTSVVFDMDYSDIVVSAGRLIIYNSRNCLIYNTVGKKKAELDFRDDVRLLVPEDRANRFLMLTDTGVSSIKLD